MERKEAEETLGEEKMRNNSKKTEKELAVFKNCGSVTKFV